MGRANGETHDPKSGFESLPGAANDHQTDMQNCRPDKNADHQKQRQQHDHKDHAKSHPDKPGYSLMAIPSQHD